MTAPVQQDSTAEYALAAAVTARTVQLTIRARLMQDVARLWPLLDASRLTETFPGWLRAMSALIGTYHGQSSAAAGSFYRASRAHALQSPTPLGLIRPAAPPSEEWLARALGFAGPGMLSRDTARPNTALSTTLGTAARIALDGGRSTILETVKADPAAVGWWFKTDGDPCFWCAMIASRGVVFKQHSLERSNARFTGEGTAKVHNSCGCIVAPAFVHSQPLDAVNDSADAVWRKSTSGLSGKAARAAFRAAWDERQASTETSPSR